MASKLWVDRYRPGTLEQLDFHADLNKLLGQLGDTPDLPHLLFYGPSGGGKKTRVLALLNSIYGAGVFKVKCESRTFRINSINIDVSVISSNYHIDITPSDVSYRDKVVVQRLIKEIGCNRVPDQRAFKVVVLNQADKLTQEAQAALRRTMEKCMSTTRIVMICNSLCRVIAPLRSRCLCIRVPAPTQAEIKTVLVKIINQEKDQKPNEQLKVPLEVVDRVLLYCKRNVRRAIMCIQSLSLHSRNIPIDIIVPVPEWERYLKEVVNNAMEEQSPKRLKIIRGKLFDVLCSCISPNVVFNYLTRELMQRSDLDVKYEIAKYAAEYQLQMMAGSKPIMHLEAFLSRFMLLNRRHSNRVYYSSRS